ncbi:DUF1835 domain-containing protein [Neobacillus drentensis]|uniref:DUF1835 domain-containing protein n=1 Tax=Neobacillus drentensis TaxID=220684 RepID=UPI00300298AB
MQHIVNGDFVADKLRQGIVQGDVLVWREVYPEGPIYVDPAQFANRSVRAQYLEHSMGIPSAEYIRTCLAQEQALSEFQKYEEVVLWFEHDLFDQTMLCYLLHWFAQRPLGRTKLSLLCIGSYPGIELFRGLGQLSVEQMETLSGTWQTVGEDELRLGSAVWEAYAASDPLQLSQILQGDTSALPFVHDAFQLHLSRLPSTYNGLGVIEQITLEKVDDGLNNPLDLFEQVGNYLNDLGMGDLQYWHRLSKMTQGPYPLLRIEGLDTFPDYKDTPPSFRHCHVVLTEMGRRVMEGQTDQVVKNGIDEWYGGIHLCGNTVPWRWDVMEQRIIRMD